MLAALHAQAAKPSICSAQPLTQFPTPPLTRFVERDQWIQNPSANLEHLNAAVSAIEELQVQVRDIKEEDGRVAYEE